MATRVQEGWDQAIENFSEIDSWDRFVSWCGKYAPVIFQRAERFQRIGIRDYYFVDRLVKRAFWEYRRPYMDSLDANLGIVMAPNSQSFSFREVTEALCNDKS